MRSRIADTVPLAVKHFRHDFVIEGLLLRNDSFNQWVKTNTIGLLQRAATPAILKDHAPLPATGNRSRHFAAGRSTNVLRLLATWLAKNFIGFIQRRKSCLAKIQVTRRRTLNSHIRAKGNPDESVFSDESIHPSVGYAWLANSTRPSLFEWDFRHEQP